MLKWLFRAFLFRTVLRRFWPLAIAFALARRFMSRDDGPGRDGAGRQRGYQ